MNDSAAGDSALAEVGQRVRHPVRERGASGFSDRVHDALRAAPLAAGFAGADKPGVDQGQGLLPLRRSQAARPLRGAPGTIFPRINPCATFVSDCIPSAASTHRLNGHPKDLYFPNVRW
jgi:hypothetical protein